jgi:hypothetical protein
VGRWTWLMPSGFKGAGSPWFGWKRVYIKRVNGVPYKVYNKLSRIRDRHYRSLHQRHATQIFDCISRTLEGQPGHSRLQASMSDEEELDCAPHNRKTITWTPNDFLSSLDHDTGFSTLEGFNKEKLLQDWTPTTANTWVCPSRTSPSSNITNAPANASR